MAIQTLHDTGNSYPITSKMDGGVYGTAIADCVCKGIGDEFTINYTSNSLDVYFNAGSQAVIGGSFFRVTSLTSITLAANSTIYLCANINLANPNGSTGSFAQRTSSNMQSDNLNGSGTSRDLLLYVVTTGANGVTAVSDRRSIKGDGGSVIADLNMTNLQTVSDGAIPALTSLPTAAYSGSGKKVVYSTTSPSTTYNNYVYVNPTYQNQLAKGAVPILTTPPTSPYTGGGVKIVYLASEPTNKYNGYIYLIKE